VAEARAADVAREHGLAAVDPRDQAGQFAAEGIVCHLKRVLRSYFHYYDRWRTHLSLEMYRGGVLFKDDTRTLTW
jgi:hypothetical protein